MHNSVLNSIFISKSIPYPFLDWEKEDGAFKSLQFQYNHCDAAECACPKGRNYSKESGDWEIIKCKFCGANGAHAKCRNGDIEKTLDCENCVKNAFSIQEMGSRCSQNIDNKISGCEDNDSTSTNNEMQNYRLTNFFDTADFEAKPPPFPWLV